MRLVVIFVLPTSTDYADADAHWHVHVPHPHFRVPGYSAD